jgi:hypothetical protein
VTSPSRADANVNGHPFRGLTLPNPIFAPISPNVMADTMVLNGLATVGLESGAHNPAAPFLRTKYESNIPDIYHSKMGDWFSGITSA